ncbi:MAG TPA: histidine triad nucleotide-binding protein [Usitatibacteraceae bacterium]|nr:histidine triad nucleotide-binding protein [Usitatibacteraceae bacterium]
MSDGNDTIFGKILRGEIPCKRVYEDDEVLAFHDIHPVAEVHFLIIPKRFIPSLAETTPEDAPILGKLLALAPILAREQGLTDGFRTAINTGRMGRQDVYHLHIHVFGNKPDGNPLKVMHGS